MSYQDLQNFTPYYNPFIHNGWTTVKVRRADQEEWETLIQDKPNLLTNGGRDFIHNQSYRNTSAGTEGTRYIAVTTNATAPDAADTVLTGEITTNGLARAAATTNSHTNGTNVSTLGVTYTATGSHTNVQKSGLFNQLSVGGTMTHENTFTPVSLVTDDQLQVTWTLTLG